MILPSQFLAEFVRHAFRDFSLPKQGGEGDSFYLHHTALLRQRNRVEPISDGGGSDLNLAASFGHIAGLDDLGLHLGPHPSQQREEHVDEVMGRWGKVLEKAPGNAVL